MGERDVLEGLQQLFDERRRRREADAERYRTLDPDLCQLCGAYGEDKRTLRLRYFYAIDEVLPEAMDVGACEELPEAERGGYRLRTCKACRGRFLAMLALWRRACLAMRDVPKDSDGHRDDWPEDACIAVREYGAIRRLTRAEWDAEYRDRVTPPPSLSDPAISSESSTDRPEVEDG